MSVCWEQRSRPILASIDTSPSLAPQVSTGFGSCGVSGVHSTRSQQRHSSIHSCRHASTTVTLFWRVRRKWRLTSFNEWWMLWLVWSLAHTKSAEAYRGYCTLNCTGSTCPSESRTSSASWCTVAWKVKRRSTWSTSAYQYPTSLLGSISDPPVDDSWFFRDTGCKRTADGLSLLLARQPGTHCLTIWEIRVSPETASADFWKHICSLCTKASSALEVLRKCVIQIYYLLTYFKLNLYLLTNLYKCLLFICFYFFKLYL